MIVPLGPEHVDAVTRLHAAGLRGLLSELGVAATRAYYTGCVRTRTAVGFVALEDGAVCGFVMGSTEPKRLKREVLSRNAAATVAAIALGIMQRPAALVSLLRSFRGPDEGAYDGQTAELIYLAVDVQRRASGVGKSLVQAFTRAMTESGVSSFELSVHEDNQAAIGFYEAQGFRVIGRYREFGALYRRYKLEWT